MSIPPASDASVALAGDLGIRCGTLPSGALNTIADVRGVRVGHSTLLDGDLKTGISAILPHSDNLFREKLPAGVEVINGFGKSAGLVQVEELGTLETPILLTNTFGVGTCVNALVRHALSANSEIGGSTGTVNPVVMECNDGYLSNIRAMAITEDHAMKALETAEREFVQGSVGAGTGMSAFGFKGGIGSASRVFRIAGRDLVLGALVLANFGRAGDLTLPDGRRPIPAGSKDTGERGSVIVVLATDAPLDARQLKRVAKRAGAGLARLGAYYGNGSGDIALAFSTARRLPHFASSSIMAIEVLREDLIDVLFQAAAETTQEAVLNAMVASPRVVGRNGHMRPSLADWLMERNM